MSGIIKEISIPELNDVKFGENLKTQFDNINNNFNILASAEFLKGVPGENIELIDIEVFNKINNQTIFTEMGAKLFNAIFNINEIQEGDTLDDIKDRLKTINDGCFYNIVSNNGKSVFDDFLDDNLEYTKTIKLYGIDKDNIKYSPMNYFRDARIDDLNDAEANSLKFTDASCSYIYDGETFKTYTLYPTLYYNTSLSKICWKVGGEETSIAAQGLPGVDGESCRTHLIKCHKDSNTSTESLFVVKMTYYFYVNQWYNVESKEGISALLDTVNREEDADYKKIEELCRKTDIYHCIINDGEVFIDTAFTTNPSWDEGAKFTIPVDELNNRKNFVEEFREMVKNFNEDPRATLKGFYLPFKADEKSVHSIYTEPGSDNDKLIIDIESKGIYENTTEEEAATNAEMVIKKHDVTIEQNLNVGDQLDVKARVLIDDGEIEFTKENAKINSKSIELTTEKLSCSGSNNNSNILVDNFNKIAVGNFEEIQIGGSKGDESDKDLTIEKDVDVNINGKLNIQGNEFNYYDYLPIGSTIELATQKYNKIDDNGKYYFDYTLFKQDFKNWVVCDPFKINEDLDDIFNLDFITYDEDNKPDYISFDKETGIYTHEITKDKYTKTSFFGLYLYDDYGDGELVMKSDSSNKPFYIYYNKNNEIEVCSESNKYTDNYYKSLYENVKNVFKTYNIGKDKPYSENKYFLVKKSDYKDTIGSTGLSTQYVHYKVNSLISSHYMIGVPLSWVKEKYLLRVFLASVYDLEENYIDQKLNSYFSYPYITSNIVEYIKTLEVEYEKYEHSYKYITKIR